MVPAALLEVTVVNQQAALHFVVQRRVYIVVRLAAVTLDRQIVMIQAIASELLYHRLYRREQTGPVLNLDVWVSDRYKIEKWIYVLWLGLALTNAVGRR